MKELKESLPAVIDEKTTILILGTMPGDESLKAKRYYNNPKNQFWKIIASIYNAGNPFSSYEDKINALKRNKIGLWDVIKSCEREGSSDKSIRNPKMNDFDALFKRFPKIKKIIFNGKKAYDKYYSKIDSGEKTIEQLSSTSPANTHKGVEEKTAEWKKALLA
jgi:TDG/mug DNA glycosylase family protein